MSIINKEEIKRIVRYSPVEKFFEPIIDNITFEDIEPNTKYGYRTYSHNDNILFTYAKRSKNISIPYTSNLINLVSLHYNTRYTSTRKIREDIMKYLESNIIRINDEYYYRRKKLERIKERILN